MTDYVPYVNPVALESMPLTGTDQHGQLVNASGTDPINEGFFKPIMDAASAGMGIFDVPIQAGTRIGTAAATTANTSAISKFGISKTLLFSALLVVLGLIIFSRALGMIGGDEILSLADPEAFPGIGHAIQGIRKRK